MIFLRAYKLLLFEYNLANSNFHPKFCSLLAYDIIYLCSENYNAFKDCRTSNLRIHIDVANFCRKGNTL